METAIILEAINILLLIFLMYVYVQNYKEMKTNLGLGLIIFSAFLFLQNAIALYFHLMMVNYYSPDVMVHAMILNGAQTIALAVLAWVTWKE